MKRKTFTFLLALLIIVGCVSNTSVPTSTSPIDTPTPTTKNTPTTIPLSDDKCVEVKTGDLDELNSAGTIVLEDMHYKAYTINANIFENVELTKEDEIVFSIAVSPDRQLTAYYLYSRNNDTSNLVIMDSSGVTQLAIPWEEDWSFISSWLDNQRLLVNVNDELSDGHPDLAAKEFSTFLVFNPFTGERELLQPDFPNIYSHHMFPAWTGFGSTVYNSTLDRVVYLQADSVDADFHYVLWDIDEQRNLADFEVTIEPNAIPRWSSDGEKIAMAPSLNMSGIRERWPAYDLYIVSRDGDVEKITNLSDYYSWFYIGEFSWSPDGKYIAFWFSAWTEQPQTYDLIADQYLAIVDTKNYDLSIYCISGKPQGNGRVSPPVWSPDGQQILIESPLPDEYSQVLLLDLNRNVITIIGKDMTPIGWMVEP